MEKNHSKKYRLIREYPGSPKLGTVITGTLLFHTVYGNLELRLYPEFWEEVKEPILTTEDGVDLYEEDDYWYVYLANYDIHKSIVSIYSETYSTSKTFSTLQAAEEYVRLNKPVFSRRQLLNFLNSHRTQEVQYGNVFIDISYEKWLKFVNNEDM